MYKNSCKIDSAIESALPMLCVTNFLAHSASPSFLWKEVARSAGGWLRSFSPSTNPLPFGRSPSKGRG